MNNIIINKIERTDRDIDNSVYEIKTPYEEDNGIGGKVTKYRVETVPCEGAIEKYDEEISFFNEKILELEAKKTEIGKLLTVQKK